MTEQQARRLLEKPKFGDLECLKAIRLLEDSEEEECLRAALEGKHTRCWCCGGTGELTCKAMCTHECPTCQGAEGLTLTEWILADLVLDQLRDLARELNVSAETPVRGEKQTPYENLRLIPAQ
jgi:hypothetical protein